MRSWKDVAAELLRGEDVDLLIADVDPAVAGWGADVEGLLVGFADAETALAEQLSSCAMVWATNSTRLHNEAGLGSQLRTPGGHRLLVGAGKPGTSTLAEQIDALTYRRTVVVGDQWLTDGLLARRLRATFLLWKGPTPAPWWAKAQSAIGWLAFRPWSTDDVMRETTQAVESTAIPRRPVRLVR